MKDLEKLQEEYEQKIMLAQKENELETFLGIECIGVSVIGRSRTQEDKMLTAIYPKNREQLSKVLRRLTPTEMKKVHVGDFKHIQLPYQLSLCRGVKDTKNKLSIEWIYGEYHIMLDIFIDKYEYPDLYLVEKYRELSQNEIEVYFGGRKNLWGEPHKCYTWSKGKVVNFVGGHYLQADENTIIEIITQLKHEL